MAGLTTLGFCCLQVKELGILVQNCPCLTKDMAKIFDVFWYMGQANATVPRYWPYEYSTNINNNTALPLYFNQTPAEVYISVSTCSIINAYNALTCISQYSGSNNNVYCVFTFHELALIDSALTKKLSYDFIYFVYNYMLMFLRKSIYAFVCTDLRRLLKNLVNVISPEPCVGLHANLT